MNILLIGNGFDLAHGLPTKYTDFLEWIKVIKQVVKIKRGETFKDVNWGNTNDKIKDLIIDRSMSRNSFFPYEKICNELLKDNIWIEYFLQCDMYQKENWIDFESEISRVIQSIDIGMKNRNDGVNSIISGLENEFLNDTFLNNQIDIIGEVLHGKKIVNKKGSITYKRLIERLEIDLDRLIRTLEIYLAEYVNVISVTEECKAIQGINPDYVLSFNYSNTHERLYGNGKKVEYDYIHGKADINNTIESNNMVLGIDEYLGDDRKDKDIEFIAFKKYYQRIYKGTGCEYRNWIFKVRESAKSIELRLRAAYPIQIPFIKFTNDARHNLYIFGHSLDVTDKDVLRELILNDNVYTKIYCYDKKDLKSKIANLVKVIGPDELVRRTGGSTKTITFNL